MNFFLNYMGAFCQSLLRIFCHFLLLYIKLTVKGDSVYVDHEL
jgi:hypothetical protein